MTNLTVPQISSDSLGRIQRAGERRNAERLRRGQQPRPNIRYQAAIMANGFLAQSRFTVSFEQFCEIANDAFERAIDMGRDEASALAFVIDEIRHDVSNYEDICPMMRGISSEYQVRVYYHVHLDNAIGSALVMMRSGRLAEITRERNLWRAAAEGAVIRGDREQARAERAETTIRSLAPRLAEVALERNVAQAHLAAIAEALVEGDIETAEAIASQYI